MQLRKMNKKILEIFIMKTFGRFRTTLPNAVITGFLLFSTTLVIIVESAYGSPRTFYSIQVAALTNLRQTKIQVNSLKKKEEIVFLKKTHIPGKGKYYRIYLGKFKNRVDALKRWKKLVIEGPLSYYEIHKFIETVDREATKARKTTTVAVDADLFQISQHPKAGKRFVDNQDGTITDTKYDLMWVKNGRRFDFFSAKPWEDAKKKCKNFKLAGYTDWRLPSISEWNFLINSNNRSPALVEPNPFGNIVFHMPYWSGTEYLAGKYKTSSAKFAARAYTVMLYSGKVNHQRKAEMAFILPIRSIN